MGIRIGHTGGFGMKATLVALAIALAMAVSAAAYEPVKTQVKTSPGEVTATPDMWFYQQYMQEYLDPKLAVRRNAEIRADQRLRRVESMRWFGLSNERPQASADPQHGDYSPGWVSNNTWYPERWTGMGRPWIVIEPGSYSPR